MNNRFACPHCGKEYPILPSLLGRKVRCKGCSEAFVLGSDGQASPVADSQAPNQERRRHFEELSSDWAKRATTAVVQRKAAYSTATMIPVTRSITSREEAKRRALRADLSAAADRAAAAVLADKTAETANASTTAPLLQGRGLASSRLRRRIAVALFVLVALLGAAWYVRPQRSADAALWHAIGGNADNDAALAELIWLEIGVDDGDPLLLADPGDIALGESRVFAVQSFAADISPLLQGRQPSPRLAAFVLDSQVDDLRGALLQLPPPLRRDRAIRLLREQGFDLLLYEEVADKLEACIPDRDACNALARLLSFAAAGDDNERWRRLLEAEPPRRIRLRQARGRGAVLLRPEGNRLRARECPAWSGSLLSVNGSGWPDNTRVLSCRPLDRIEEEGGPLRLTAQLADKRFAGHR